MERSLTGYEASQVYGEGLVVFPKAGKQKIVTRSPLETCVGASAQDKKEKDIVDEIPPTGSSALSKMVGLQDWNSSRKWICGARFIVLISGI